MCITWGGCSAGWNACSRIAKLHGWFFCCPADSLPRGQEIGSTWIYGVAADPRKNSWYRAAARARSTMLEQHPALATDPRVKEFSRLLLKVPVRT